MLARLHEDLSDKLAWIGIVTTYGDLIKSLQYFMKLFEEYKKAAGQNFRKRHSLKRSWAHTDTMEKEDGCMT